MPDMSVSHLALQEPLQIAAACIFALVALLYGKRVVQASQRPPLPPGPPRSLIPFVGNYFDIKRWKGSFPELLDQWREEYGPIYSYQVFREVTIVLSDYQMVHELMELRSTNYSSRPDMPMLRDFISRNNNISFNLYDGGWRRLRRAVHKELNVNQAKQYAWIQEREAYVFAQGVFDHLVKEDPTPNGLFIIGQRFGGSISFGALYDHRVKVDSDPLINEWSENLAARLEFFKPGSSLYDHLPWFRWLPEFIMTSKRRARIAREGGEELDRRLSQGVQDRLAAGEDTSSFHSGLLDREKEGKSDLTVFERDSLTGMAAVAAIDTSIATTISLVKALVCFPEVQKKVQEEVDRVVGRDRLPLSADLPNLPYCRAFVREVMRWREITRIGVPHATTSEDVYRGFYIPKKAVVISFAWAMARDPKMFPDFDTVRPERYIDPKTGDLNNTPFFSFGFGRRICVGMNLAQTSTGMAIASLAWAFNFEHAKDAAGKDIPIDTHPWRATVENGTIFTPKPFDYMVKPRFPDVEAKVRKAAAANY